MILTQGNKGKELYKEWNGETYARYPIQTKTIMPHDDLMGVMHGYLDENIEAGDIIGIAESMISVTQKRAYKFSEIKYGYWAKLLSRFVKRTPAGIGLGTPQTMQLAINEVGLLRILCAAGFSAITKPFGVVGLFYRIAGARARGIDGPTENTLPPYNEYASLLPKNPNKILRKLDSAFKEKEVLFCIVDANDIGVNVIGRYSKSFSDQIKVMFSDNPLGQGSESTPLLICRKVNR